MTAPVPIPAALASRITASQQGEGWTVFLDRNPVVTGLRAYEVPFYKRQVAEAHLRLFGRNDAAQIYRTQP